VPGDKDSKTEQPTAKKRREARKEGQFAKTPDAATWTAIAAGVALVPKSASVTAGQVDRILALIPSVGADPTPAMALKVLDMLPMAVLKGAAPSCLAAAAGAIIATVAQGVHPSGKMLKPKFSRMKPTEGLKRMFGPRAAWEAVKALGKMSVVAVVVVVVGKKLIPELAGAGALPLSTTVSRAHSGMQGLVFAAALAGLALAGADYFYQKHTVTKQLMMTPKEVKDEYKQTEGDPMLKGAIRHKQLMMSRNRMMAQIPKADVVLVNPTHLAVALQYRAGRGAPRVIAKGAGPIALMIREIARENRIPVVEDKPLARALYRICDLEDEIPSELYLAVARILAFVMAAAKPTRRAGPRRPTHKMPLPTDLPTKVVLKRRQQREARAAKHAAR
jgi:flagellar biosynthetic protein FlhB